MRHGESAMGSRALGVHAALGDDLAIEVGQLFDQPDVLKERRAATTGGLDIQVVAHGHSRRMGHVWRFVGHETALGGREN